MIYVEYLSNRSIRKAYQFGRKYDFMQYDYELQEIAQDYESACGGEIPTGAFVRMGDAEFLEVWVTFSNRPYDLTCEYNKVISYFRKH